MSAGLLPEVGALYHGKYLLQDVLGQGGSATVYRARQVHLHQQLALKILGVRSGKVGDAQLAQLRLEASIFGRLGNNAHVVQAFDVDVDAATGTQFLAMELLEGSNLWDWVRSRGPLRPSLVLSIAKQVAVALTSAHGYVDDAGVPSPIVHRDLTPQNVFLVGPASEQPHVKLLDFGLAELRKRGNTQPQATSGTPIFLAYEQLKGLEWTPRTDIWAFGLVVHFMLTGEIYWLGRDAEALEQEIAVNSFEAPSERLRRLGIAGQLPGGYDDWLLCCLARVSTRRFASIGACFDELFLLLNCVRSELERPLFAKRALEPFAALGPSGPRSYVVTCPPSQPPRRTRPSQTAEDRVWEALADGFLPEVSRGMRLADDLMTATGHHLAFPPDEPRTYQSQLRGIAAAIKLYDKAQKRLREAMPASEALLRDLHGLSRLELYQDVQQAMSVVLSLKAGYQPTELVEADYVGAYARESSRWQSERVRVFPLLDLLRSCQRGLLRKLEEAAEERPPYEPLQPVRSEAVSLLSAYVDQVTRFGRVVEGHWLALRDPTPASRYDAAMEMARCIEATNQVYEALDLRVAGLTFRLTGAQQGSDVRLATELSHVANFQWHELRPHLNAGLVRVIRFVTVRDRQALNGTFEEDREGWQRLASLLLRARERFGAARAASD